MSTYVTRVEGPATESIVARDIVKRGLYVTPLILLVSLAIWGWAGAASSAYAIGLVCINFLFAATLITRTARISLGLMMGAVLFGFVIRLGLIALAVLLVRHLGWYKPLPLGLTIIGTHLGLLVWELRYVSATLAFPGLRPSSKDGR